MSNKNKTPELPPQKRAFPGPAGFDQTMAWARYTTGEEDDREQGLLRLVRNRKIEISQRERLNQITVQFDTLLKQADETGNSKAREMLEGIKGLITQIRVEIKYGGTRSYVQAALNKLSEILAKAESLM